MKNRTNITDLSDSELFDLLRTEHQTRYFGELYRRYIPLLYGVCLNYLGNEDDAQDAVMDLFEGLSQKIANYRIDNFHAWLYTVAKNHCLLKLRKEKNLFFVDINEAVMENGDLFTLSDEERSEEERSALAFCLNELGEEQRRSIAYFYYEEKSYADIVSLTGYTPDKVKSYIQNGKRNLKNCIVKVLGTDKQS